VKKCVPLQLVCRYNEGCPYPTDAWKVGSVEEEGYIAVGLCRLNQVDPYPITYSLSNP
jgi:hypothetical protein